MRPVRRILVFAPLLILAVVLLGLPAVAFGDDDRHNNDFTARFLGINEVPSVSTDATASLRVKINSNSSDPTITYTFRFSNLRAPVTQAHIHFAQTHTNGGVMVFLCGTASNPGPAGTPTCEPDKTITRTLHSADVVGGAAAQGIAAGEMNRVIRAIRDGASYGNVHSQMFTGGEARGQLHHD
jgi:hypothetical protein